MTTTPNAKVCRNTRDKHMFFLQIKRVFIFHFKLFLLNLRFFRFNKNMKSAYILLAENEYRRKDKLFLSRLFLLLLATHSKVDCLSCISWKKFVSSSDLLGKSFVFCHHFIESHCPWFDSILFSVTLKVIQIVLNEKKGARETKTKGKWQW